MKLLINPARIRSVIADARTEKDVELSLRRHKIRYHYDTSSGYTAIAIPCRKGIIRIYRSVSRSAPFIIRSAPSKSLRPWSACY